MVLANFLRSYLYKALNAHSMLFYAFVVFISGKKYACAIILRMFGVIPHKWITEIPLVTFHC